MMSDANNIRKPHQCEHCTKSFASSHQLAQHIRIHTGEKPYKCSYCEKSFKQLSHVQQHTRLHTGERPYKCPAPDCGRAFIQLSNLQQHMRNHVSSQEKHDRDRDKSHFCGVCRKGFKAQANLLTHKCKKNADLTRFAGQEVCSICQICLPNKELLLEHLRNQHHDSSCDVQSRLLNHMEQMRTDSKHQFEAQIVLSCAAAERRAREAVMNQVAMVAQHMITQNDHSPMPVQTSNGSMMPMSVKELNVIQNNSRQNHDDLNHI